jgi:hypothetical protein
MKAIFALFLFFPSLALATKQELSCTDLKDAKIQVRIELEDPLDNPLLVRGTLQMKDFWGRSKLGKAQLWSVEDVGSKPSKSFLFEDLEDELVEYVFTIRDELLGKSFSRERAYLVIDPKYDDGDIYDFELICSSVSR